MTIRKRAAKVRAAFDRGLYRQARWHLAEIMPLLKSEETEHTLPKAKEDIDQLERALANKEGE